MNVERETPAKQPNYHNPNCSCLRCQTEHQNAHKDFAKTISRMPNPNPRPRSSTVMRCKNCNAFIAPWKAHEIAHICKCGNVTCP